MVVKSQLSREDQEFCDRVSKVGKTESSDIGKHNIVDFYSIILSDFTDLPTF